MSVETNSEIQRHIMNEVSLIEVIKLRRKKRSKINVNNFFVHEAIDK